LAKARRAKAFARAPVALDDRSAAIAVCARRASLRKRVALVVIRRGCRPFAAVETERASAAIVLDHLLSVVSSVTSLATALDTMTRLRAIVNMSRAEPRSVAAVLLVALVGPALLILALVVIVLALRILILALLGRARLIAGLIISGLILDF
jgi:hypothetical protein